MPDIKALQNRDNHHHFKEAWSRSLLKAITYRIVILILDFTVIYWLTGKSEIALGFMVASNIYTTIAYYFHERAWDNVKWGKTKKLLTTDITPYDPAGHTKIAVSDFKKSLAFYKTIFEFLNYKMVSEKPDHASWASPMGYGIIIAQATNTINQYQIGMPGLHHLCLKTDSKEIVDKIYQILIHSKTKIFDPPQLYPDYTDQYYAVYFADPDGIKLEVAYY
ncbi:MAG: DUF2061 domain-containing protein [Candidatus Magasanikbacteria bacterium]|jgi:uncharacterized membrane protein/catechol 2,3-dioxygenase-like lactoylglutathione lyase family enzyme